MWVRSSKGSGVLLDRHENDGEVVVESTAIVEWAETHRSAQPA
jgi:hypothetical protein